VTGGGAVTGKRVLAIVGPTAVGKTALSIALAQALGGEIVSADSRQIYRGMDIGTAKATPAEQAAVRHHLIDVVAPDEVLSLARYRDLARAAIAEIRGRGRLPIIVGGTGLYVRALVEGWTIPEVPPDEALRARLYARAEAEGGAVLHAELAQVDPSAAAGIDARNVRRVIRALEVYAATGRPISALQRKEPPEDDFLQLGLTLSRQELYARIDARVEAMLARGLAAEVQCLLEAGYSAGLPAMSGLGYREMVAHLRGETTLEEAAARIKHNTRRLVRQQYTWFRLSDPAIHWFDAAHLDVAAVQAHVCAWLAGRDGPLREERP
jgi:tRNA dimethylallyltransferase